MLGTYRMACLREIPCTSGMGSGVGIEVRLGVGVVLLGLFPLQKCESSVLSLSMCWLLCAHNNYYG